MSKPTSTSSLEDRLDRMQRELAAHQRRLNTRTRVTGFVSAIVLVALAVYFYVGYSGFGELTEPGTLVALVDSQIDENMPVVRKNLQNFVINESPAWAEQLSADVQASLPSAREELEDYIVVQMDTLLEQTSAMTAEQFRGFLKDNREVLDRGFQDLAASPNMVAQTVNELTEGIDKQFSRQMQEDATQLFDTLFEMNRKIAKLSDNKGLNAEQQLERRMLMLTRRLQKTVEPYPPDDDVAPPRGPRPAVPPAEAANEPPPADEPPGDAAPSGTAPDGTAPDGDETGGGDKPDATPPDPPAETTSPPEPEPK